LSAAFNCSSIKMLLGMTKGHINYLLKQNTLSEMAVHYLDIRVI